MQSFLDASREFDYFPADLIDKLMIPTLYDKAYELYGNTLGNCITEYGETILGGAYTIELSKNLGKEINIDFVEKERPYTQRNIVFEDFKKVKNKGLFSDNTIKLLREKILERYEKWKPDIQREFMESAAGEAQIKASKKSSPTVCAWVVGIASLMFIWTPIWSTTKATAGGAVLVVGAAIFTGIITAKVVRSRIKNKLEEELITSMRKKEKETLDTIL